jgi:hypothetical protein
MAHRRIVLKPAGLSENERSRLAELLSDAVELQAQLAARSPHILQFVGAIREKEHAFVIEHEPAQPFPVQALFAPDRPKAEPTELLRTAVALIDVLRVAHGMQGPRPAVHGGLCPGVLLMSRDGVEKVSDFGFAPAICAALGPERYLNLAVGPTGEGAGEDVITGAWEVLPPAVLDRDDRICSFIDPEKYATRLYQSFEPGSDIVAAGFILHLMAEHRHPYFHDDPEAHRMMEVAEYMAMGTATRARRKDLRESTDPATQLWCELVGKMIDRLPQNRPSAAVLAEQLGRFHRPVGLGDVLLRRFEAICARLGQKTWGDSWDDIRRDAKAMAGAADAPPELKEHAGAVLALCAAADTLRSERWPEAAGPLATIPAVSGLPEPVVRKAQEAAQIIDRSLAVRRGLEQIAASLRECEQREPAEALTEIESLCAQADRLTGEASVLPSITERVRHVAEELAAKREQVLLGAQQSESIAREWVASLRTASEAGEWEAVELALAKRPAITKWLEDVRAEAARIEERVRERHQLIARLRTAEEQLSRGSVPEAREAVASVERQGTYPDLRDQARALRERIDEEDRRRIELEARIRTARERAEELLAGAEEAASSDAAMDLERGGDCAREALAIPEISPAQRDRAEGIRGRIDSRLKAIFAKAEFGVEALRKAEEDVAEARRLLEAGSLLKSEEKARPHAQSGFPHVQSDAARILEAVAEALARHRSGLRAHLDAAAEHIRQNRLDDAVTLAGRVEKDEYAGESLRTEARRTMEAAETARKESEKARLQAIADRDQALAALRDADLANARAHAERVLNNGHADTTVRGEAEAVIRELPALDAAKVLIDQEEFDRAATSLAAIGERAAGAAEPIAKAAFRATDLLKRQAQQLRKALLVRSIELHLEHRAEREGQSLGTDAVPPEESLPASAPQWVRTTLTDFETFLHDCAAATRPAPAGEVMAPGARVGEKYEVVAFLGRGGMGEVYRARDLALDREVAIKLAPASAENAALSEALRNEAKAIAALSHPHIIHINSFDVIQGRPCFDTNYIRGQDLGHSASEHPPTERQVAEILVPVAEALAYAHRQGVLHGDVKPQNIYLGERPGEGPWLIDFGLARIRSICDQRANTGLCGTPGYLAPEVITSMGEEVDHRADIFALGCVLYALLAGEPPFQRPGPSGGGTAPSVSRTLLHTLRAEVTPLSIAAPAASEALRRICERAMAHEPQDRYADASEIAHELRRFLVQLDHRQAETTLAEARGKLEARPKRETAELGALDEVCVLAENAGRFAEEIQRRVEHTGGLATETQVRAISQLGRQAAGLAEEARRLRQRIVESQGDAAKKLQAADAALAGRRYRAARTAAQAVLANPYVPEMRADAERILGQAEPPIRRAARRRLKIGAVAVCVVIGALALYRPWRVGPPTAPTIAPAGGTFTESVQVTLACPSSGATIRFTTDGSNPTVNSPQYAGPFVLKHSATVKAVAFKGHANKSEITGAAFDIRTMLTVATPKVSPNGGTFADSVQVAMACATAGATIHYTTDGGAPTPAAPQYSTPFSLSGPATVKARAFMSGAHESGIVSATFVVKATPTVAMPTISPNGGTFADSVQVALACATAGATIHYTTDGGEPTPAAPQYITPFSLSGRATVKARAFMSGAHESGIASATFVVTATPTVATPTISPNGGTFTDAVQVTLGCATPGATIRYTTDGKEPTPASPPYSTPLSLTGPTVVQAKAFMSGAHESGVISATFDVKPMPTAATPTISPNGGSFTDPVSVTLTCQTPGAAIRYTTDGAEPTAVATRYSGPFTLTQSSTVKARAFAAGFHDSAVALATFTRKPPPPLLVWPAFDEPMQQRIKGLLTGAQVGGSPLQGADPDWITIATAGGKLGVTLDYPWSKYDWAANKRLVVGDVPFPRDGLPGNAEQRADKTAASITAALKTAGEADATVAAALQYLRFWPQRTELERDLMALLPANGNGPIDLDAARLSGKTGYLTRLARIKWMADDVPDAPPIGEWIQHTQDVLEKNRNEPQIAIRVRPTRFIEYFWGPEYIHAIYWYADGPGLPVVRYARLGPSNEIGREVGSFVTNRVSPPGLADQLLGPIIRDTGGPAKNLGFFAMADPTRSFGMAIAPDGPLCLLPITRLPFAQVQVNMSLPDAAVISDVPRRLSGGISRLDALFTGSFRTVQTAMWILVSLEPAPNGMASSAALWQTPCAMVINQGQLAPVRSVHSFGRAYNADLVRLEKDMDVVAAALGAGLQRVDRQFNAGAGGESFDAGFLYPRIASEDAPWFVLVAPPIPLR